MRQIMKIHECVLYYEFGEFTTKMIKNCEQTVKLMKNNEADFAVFCINSSLFLLPYRICDARVNYCCFSSVILFIIAVKKLRIKHK
jgi:hypothetical protein